MVDKNGNEIEDRIYNQRDFDKNLVLEKRTELPDLHTHPK